MPELPEVETVKTILNDRIKGVRIEDIELRYEPMVKNLDPEVFKQQLVGQTIENVSRRGKYLVFHLNDYYLLSHLRMEGKYFYEAMDFELNPHIHAIFKLNNGRQLLYQDTRKFGTFHLYDKQQDLEQTASFKVLGVEPFSDAFTPAYVKTKLVNKKKPIKSLLLDQTVVCGLGNIYVDEVLYRAKLHPLTPSQELSHKEIESVVKYTQEVLARAIELGGTTIRTFTATHGVLGTFQNELLVHQRKDEPCYECQTTIEKIKVGGRGTYFCPICQKLKS